MRSDLNKVLCERPRVGHHNRFNRVRHDKKFNARDPEMNVGRESMTIRHRVTHTWKSFNEHLNPLFGIVRKNVGRPWNKVYSELCKVFDKRSVINQHILTHLDDCVERNVVIKDGQLWVNTPGYYTQCLLKDATYTEFYVDPKTGILKRNKHFSTYKQRARERDKQLAKEKQQTVLVVDDMTELHKIAGVWYMFTFLPLPEHTVETHININGDSQEYVNKHPQFDLLKQERVYLNDCDKSIRYASHKHQLSHQQLKQYGLQNDVMEKRK